MGLKSGWIDLNAKSRTMGNGDETIFEFQRFGEQTLTGAAAKFLNQKIRGPCHGMQ